MELIKSPVVYQGNKFKLLKDILPLMPKNINTFIDVFCGSGIVGFNVLKNNMAKNILLNDLNKPIINILKKIINETDDLIWDINFQTVNNNLKRTKKDSTKEEQEEFKNNYLNFRNMVRTLNIDESQKTSFNYILHLFSFNNLIRFNQKEQFNASFGFHTGRDPKVAIEYLTEYKKLNLSKIEFFNYDFVELFKTCKTKLNMNDFIYLDPPYLNTTAVYNENRLTGWNEADEYRLLKTLDLLDSVGIKFGMSNTFSGKCGTHNEKLKEWAKKYTVHYFDKQYATFGHSNKKNIEVYITNYK